MRLHCLLFLTALLSCQSKSTLGPERIEAGFISDDSYFTDGCESYVRLARLDSVPASIYYKPTQSTLPRLQRALAAIPASKNSDERAVTIRFAETGNKVIVKCGWVNKPQTGEIEIFEIKAR